MSTIGRLQDAMEAALDGYETGNGTRYYGPAGNLDRETKEAIIEEAIEVAWQFIEAERRAR